MFMWKNVRKRGYDVATVTLLPRDEHTDINWNKYWKCSFMQNSIQKRETECKSKQHKSNEKHHKHNANVQRAAGSEPLSPSISSVYVRTYVRTYVRRHSPGEHFHMVAKYRHLRTPASWALHHHRPPACTLKVNPGFSYNNKRFPTWLSAPRVITNTL